MKKSVARLLWKGLFFLLLALVVMEWNIKPAHAGVQSQNSCEEEWCVCEGYTIDRLRSEYKNATWDYYHLDIVSSECADWYYKNTGADDRNEAIQEFLDFAQRQCDTCRPANTVTPEIILPKSVPTNTPPVELNPPDACLEEIDRDCDGIPDTDDLCPGLPGAHLDDMDCDDVPDNVDLCIGQFGSAEDCGCAGVGVAPGDLLFRNGGPAIASRYLPTLVGKASSEGKEYDFGHVGMYAGSFVAEQDYPVLHKNGLTVYRQTSASEQPVPIKLAQGDFVRADDIVPDAILESDMGWGGVGITNLQNFLADNSSFSGSEYAGVKVGTPRERLSCDERFDVVDIMADSARSRADGVTDYNIVTENCANKISQAYAEAAGYAPWENFRTSLPTKLWDKKVLTPNMVASFLTLNGVYSERRDTPVESHIAEPKIAIEAYSPVYLDVYDALGNHTGATSLGLEAQIPASEVWYVDDGTKVVNLYQPQLGQYYDINLRGYESGSYQLVIAALNVPIAGNVIKIVYPETQVQPETTAKIRFSTDTLDAAALTMTVDYDNNGSVDTSIQPDIQQNDLFSVAPPAQLPNQSGQEVKTLLFLGAIPGVFCFGIAFVMLILGYYQNSKRMQNFGLGIVAVTACLTFAAIGIFIISRIAEVSTTSSDNALPVDMPQTIDTPPAPLVVPSITQPIPTPVIIPTSTEPEVSAPQESSPEASIYSFAACLEPCLNDRSNMRSTFPEKTTKIYFQYGYNWIFPGDEYVRIWKSRGEEWVRYQCKWDGPESGTFEIALTEPVGLRSGEWTMEVYVNGKLVTQKSITVQGSYDYWDPVKEPITRCK